MEAAAAPCLGEPGGAAKRQAPGKRSFPGLLRSPASRPTRERPPRAACVGCASGERRAPCRPLVVSPCGHSQTPKGFSHILPRQP